MLRLSKQADYGIVLLSYFLEPDSAPGTGNGMPRSARDLAQLAELPAPMVSKILKHLTRAGILTSQRGSHGGYHLARPATEISLASIVTALEGEIAVTECSPLLTDRTCSHESHCPVRTPLQRLDSIVRRALDGVSLAELVEPTTHRNAS